MDVIEKIQIRGFGINEKLDVEFSPTVTSIIGKSYKGKSWLLRALKWNMSNKPAGTAYINWYSDEAKVRLSIAGKKVIRIRNKSVNSYRLSGKSKPFVAFGNDVPRDVAEIMNVSEINFQKQHTLPFWFCETAGEVSRQLNSIVNLEIIDSTLAAIATEIRDTGTIIKVTEKALLKATQEKKELFYVKALDIELKQVEKLQDLYQANVEKRSTIEQKLNLVAKYVSIRENRLGLVSDGSKAISAGSKYSEIAISVEKLSKLVESAESLQVVLKNRPPSIKTLGKLREKSLQQSVQCIRLEKLIEVIQDRRQERCRAEKELEECKKLLAKVAEGRCPLCGAKMV
jgi:predicted ATP-dependent endonuclease of OLD family